MDRTKIGESVRTVGSIATIAGVTVLFLANPYHAAQLVITIVGGLAVLMAVGVLLYDHKPWRWMTLGLFSIIGLFRHRTPPRLPRIAGPQVQPAKWRLTGRFPLIRGRWRNLDGKDLSISIKQTEGCGDFDGIITGEQDSARLEGRITEEGQISAIAYFLDRGKADKEEAQNRDARLSPDGALIEGTATTASGSHRHDFRWQFCE